MHGIDHDVVAKSDEAGETAALLSFGGLLGVSHFIRRVDVDRFVVWREQLTGGGAAPEVLVVWGEALFEQRGPKVKFWVRILATENLVTICELRYLLVLCLMCLL